jgi:hypothetical protein
MKHKLFKFTPLALLIALAVALPFVAQAQFGPPTCIRGGLWTFLCIIHDLLNTAIPVILALGIVYFVWGVVQYVIRDDEEAKKKGKNRMIWGIIGLAVITALWGLVNILVDTFGLYGGVPPYLVPVVDPALGSGCVFPPNPKLQDLLAYATCFIGRSVIPLIFALAAVMFVWGVVHYFILNADEEQKRTQGKMFMIWGIIALTVMVSVWSLVAILGNTFPGINTSVLPYVEPR